MHKAGFSSLSRGSYFWKSWPRGSLFSRILVPILLLNSTGYCKVLSPIISNIANPVRGIPCFWHYRMLLTRHWFAYTYLLTLHIGSIFYGPFVLLCKLCWLQQLPRNSSSAERIPRGWRSQAFILSSFICDLQYVSLSSLRCCILCWLKPHAVLW